MELSGEAPVPPVSPLMSTTSAWAFATPAATVPTPTSATSFTLMRAWWFAFYSTIMRELSRAPNAPPGGNSVFDAISCLYSSKDVCALFAGAARFVGKTPYEPMLLWVGLAGLVLGVVVRLVSRPAVRT